MCNIILVFSLLGLLSGISAQIIQAGQCNDNIALQANFNGETFAGDWYVVGRTDDPDVGGDCSTLTVTRNNATSFVFTSTTVDRNFQDIQNYSATLETGSARFTLGTTSNSMSFWILGTNYNDYAVAYNCDTVNTTHRSVYIWHLGRSQEINSIFNNMMNNLVAPLGISLFEDLRSTNYSEAACFALPYIPAGQPIILAGECDPNINLLTNLNISLFLGTWNEIYSYYSENANGSCARAEYSAGNGVVNVVNSQVYNQTLDTITGFANVSADNPAKLNVTLNITPNITISQDLWVIDTDYINYAITYSCVQLTNNTKRVFSWILSKNRELSWETQVAVNQVVDSILDLNFNYYQPTNQTDDDCFYFPEHADDSPVVFRGECDMNIPAVPNFNLQNYTGLWHEIESYPSLFQDGTCSNANYTLSGGQLDVRNTQVVYQTLQVMRGSAVSNTTDGSGKFQVTFPVNGTNGTVSMSYWVLATDYTNYALVYTCEYNSLRHERQVWSWKLSRTRSLSTENSTAINNVIANITVLDQRYYVTRNQTAEGCFYYPEAQEGVPVVMPGQCDQTIPVVTNFNMSLFSGTWYEIEAYPQVQSGDCVNHRYEFANNDVYVLTSFNVNQFLQNSSRMLQGNMTDGSARFNLTISNGNNETVEIPLWILAVDYNDFALAYSCINQGNDYRAVYSWKLSRNQQELSLLANITINNVIDSIDVLDDQYYFRVDQSELACASLPVIPAGQPIIIDGQCDPNIPVVSNFTADRYLGQWHLVESYWSEFQNGDCIDADYSLGQNGTIVVLNTQVVNQTLNTITGTAEVIANGKLNVMFPNATALEYWIIDTDYDSYSLVYSCVNVTATTQQVWSWKMSRTRSLSANATTAINAAIRNIRVLNNDYYSPINNTDNACFYFPEPNGLPVRFRGQCDESISVVTNFNATRYEGRWYDIESYPQFFQQGFCPTADYTVRDGGVDVFNTQVVNLTLDTIEGRAVFLNSTDGLAKLNVTFLIAGTNFTVASPYWVLATDYDNYALVYACQNNPDNTRNVSSWKLSRNRTLSTTSQTAINNAINNVDVLRDNLYEIKGHTDEECFYFPEVTGEPLVFRGQCDNNIQAVPNFDIGAFAGVWHEIETYPKAEAGGHCISHQFVNSTNTSMLLTSNQVFNSETLVTNTGQLILSSNDTSGRFNLSMVVNGTTISIPYWILATDYTDYALAYSCMDRPDGRRAVYSWKLSKSQQLSVNATAAINTTMASVDVIDQRYFEPVSQTSDACFYFPDNIQPNSFVILPGQCDPNIAVVQNFNATAFSGQWNDIESYFDGNNGTCVDGRLAETVNGFNISVTQVINNALNTASASAVLAANNTGKLVVTSNNETVEYWILNTNYSSWALLYSCQNVGSNERLVRSWKLSRTRELTPEAVISINNTMNNINVLDDRFFYPVNQTAEGCFYMPEPTGLPVRFRARCDQGIPVVQNFNVTRYLGQWFDVASYPQLFQDGECASALYEAGSGGVVLVQNRQVVAQQLDTINGTAVLANSTDASARLNVTFVVNGVPITSPYWILATDYDTYSFVYSCSEIDEEYVLVSAWKLSRNTTLSTPAETAINSIINTIPVLDQQYFNPVNHTEEACFYYPDFGGGPIYRPGQCPNPEQVPAVNNFNPNLFNGTWHEFSRLPSELQNGDCASGQYIFNNTFRITQNIVRNEILFSVEGVGELNVTTGVIQSFINGTQLNLYILDTDYTEFAILYSCRNVDSQQRQIYSWTLSRSRGSLSANATNRINAVISSNDDLFWNDYRDTDQSDAACFYYPDFYPELPRSIELPGPCNSTIRGVTNFNLQFYLGRWFEIARYPNTMQVGSCARSVYSQNNGTLEIHNSEVINQLRLVERNGTVVAANDSSGLLHVTFDFFGDYDYYILGTDYTNYALLYSCQNLTNGNRLVSSWQLSRDRTLTPQASQSINTIIANTQGLSHAYYNSTGQSNEDCFYFPPRDPDNHVVFRGQCENVTGVQNFDIQRYLGFWNEIERYPTNETVGNCITANFTSINGTIQVVDQSVSGLTANMATTYVVATNNGRLTRTQTINGTTVTTEMWVLATDYETYSFLYSCENIDDEYRRVWSAKHSRTRSLTQAANNAINQVMATMDVLHEQYFNFVTHTDTSCFYFPEATGEPVIMRGRCDTTIPVAQNFSMEEFTGTWYQTERYPQTDETGNCSGTRYTIHGGIHVLNWQVIDGELDVIQGTATHRTLNDPARLILEFPGRTEDGNITGTNVTSNLFVLATDYTTYALTYSCVNINDFQRHLAVWKLSRTRTMPATGTTAINAYMAQRQELDQRYFITVPQSEDCDEPSSSYFVKSSIMVILVSSILQLLQRQY
ncbi:uncharacterized protein LOC126375226 [Pectinophora gossypiella]|uniref:uncharacterized protein LOC126375226 n=1 Tax=Pectinophora gossypiella TaxID=13191 RepID=UPI00214EE638|nr:uncharacterized protein LOC126375226 [Pectinophora gossypiella]